MKTDLSPTKGIPVGRGCSARWDSTCEGSPAESQVHAQLGRESPQSLQGQSVNMCRSGEQSTGGAAHTPTHLKMAEERETKAAFAHFSAEPAPRKRACSRRETWRGQAWQGDAEAAEPQTNGSHTSRQQERRKPWLRGDQNVQIMSQILLPETPANEGNVGVPCHRPKLFTQVLKMHFKRKQGSLRKTLHRLWKMLSENHINLFSKKVFEVFQSTLGRL